jgi:hypothetical protein
MNTTPTRTFLGSVIAIFAAAWEWFTKEREPIDDGDPWDTPL